MSAISEYYLTLLKTHLAEKFVAHLPALLVQNKPAAEQATKNLSRAFSAFAIRHLTGITEKEAAESVVDDSDDFGLDAIYYFAPTETLFLVQAKLKASEEFKLPEALAFCQGIRKLLRQDFTGFNPVIIRRQTEIEDALDNCNAIQLVVAHTGSGISYHAKTAVEELLRDNTHGEERLKPTVADFDSGKVIKGLQSSQAYARVDARIRVQKCSQVTEPRNTYFGLAQISDLVALHNKYGKSLYDKNIRTFLGHATEVNVSIQKTLATNPSHFVYLNNGVTVLCEQIEPRSSSSTGKLFSIEGFSVINGAQTIASSAQFVADNPAANLEMARVSITLIQANADGEFGKSVTRARNHQNPVLFANFVALDEEQERLRRDLAHLGIHYAYKAGTPDGNEPDRFRAEDAAQALALFHADPRYVVWLKNDPSSLLDPSSDRYKNLFTPDLSAYELANAVRFARYVVARMNIESRGYGQEKLTYKHGSHAFGWLLAKQVRVERKASKLFDAIKLEAQLSLASDSLRQVLWNQTQLALGGKSPIQLFRNQKYAVPLLSAVLIAHYGLAADPAVIAKQGRQQYDQPYQKELFDYLISKAPQIAGLS